MYVDGVPQATGHETATPKMYCLTNTKFKGFFQFLKHGQPRESLKYDSTWTDTRTLPLPPQI